MPYAILRFQKRKAGGVAACERHNERKKEAYKSNPDIDMERSQNNYHLVKPPRYTYKKEINQMVKEAGCIQQAAQRGLDIILNPSPCDQDLLGCSLSQVRWLVLNEVEGGQITGEQESRAILQALAARFPQTGVVLTLGEEGAFCQPAGGEAAYQPCFPVKPVDTTAAGDTFLGYFAAGLAQGLPLGHSMERAAAAAALTITRQGAAPSIPSRAEVERFLEGQI